MLDIKDFQYNLSNHYENLDLSKLTYFSIINFTSVYLLIFKSTGNGKIVFQSLELFFKNFKK